jgi:putative ABC transport system permease protein
MKYLPLIWRNLLRRKVRTGFTLASVLVTFVLYGLLMTLRLTFSMGVSLAGADRLMLTNKVSIIQPLPIAYEQQIRNTPGVTLATHADWFGGVYKDPKNQIPQFPVDPVPYMQMYPEFKLPPDQMQAWLADRQGAVVDPETAKRYGWTIGTRVPLQGTIWQPKSGTWELNIVGIYDIDKANGNRPFLFRYDYFDENRRNGQGLVGWYLIRVQDPSRAAELAKALDEKFTNSTYETKTATEAAMLQSWANQVGDVGKMLIYILAAVFFTILIIVANVMAQTVRERTSELAVLKAVGFPDGLVLVLVLAESVALALIGGGVGLALAWLIASGGDPTPGYLPAFAFTPSAIWVGVASAVLLGLVAGALPAVSAMQLRITDALRRN